MKKVCIIGHFAKNTNAVNGQTIKTKIIYDEVIKKFGKDEVTYIDTYNWKKKPFKMLINCISKAKKNQNIIVLPAQNGIKIFIPLFTFFKKIFSYKLHYIVIGGWLPNFINEHTTVRKQLFNVDNIYVETSTMKKKLNKYNNVIIMPNCKSLKIIKSINNTLYSEPYKLCIFSRIMVEKGIEDAIEVIKRINEEEGYIKYELDIYGQIDSKQIEWFNNLKENFPEYIQYKGIVEFCNTTNTLKKYFLLLFPTKFYTEGVPGTIIDSYAAGVPVLASKWESFHDVIIEMETGIGYEFSNIDDFYNKLKNIDVKKILSMKKNCQRRAKLYTPKNAIQVLIENLK